MTVPPTANTTTAAVEPHPERKEIARFLLSRGDSRFEQAMADDEALLALPGVLSARSAAAHAPIAFPAGLAPQAVPTPAGTSSGDALPAADVVVITWTVDELAGLARVMTPGADPPVGSTTIATSSSATAMRSDPTRRPPTAAASAAISSSRLVLGLCCA